MAAPRKPAAGPCGAASRPGRRPVRRRPGEAARVKARRAGGARPAPPGVRPPARAAVAPPRPLHYHAPARSGSDRGGSMDSAPDDLAARLTRVERRAARLSALAALLAVGVALAALPAFLPRPTLEAREF